MFFHGIDNLEDKNMEKWIYFVSCLRPVFPCLVQVNFHRGFEFNDIVIALDIASGLHRRTYCFQQIRLKVWLTINTILNKWLHVHEGAIPTR